LGWTLVHNLILISNHLQRSNWSYPI
jgi:hypothetical protein